MPGWVQREPGDFRAVVQQAIDDNPNGWVIDGNYGGHLMGLVAKQAETVVYVNIALAVVDVADVLAVDRSGSKQADIVEWEFRDMAAGVSFTRFVVVFFD